MSVSLSVSVCFSICLFVCLCVCVCVQRLEWATRYICWSCLLLPHVQIPTGLWWHTIHLNSADIVWQTFIVSLFVFISLSICVSLFLYLCNVRTYYFADSPNVQCSHYRFFSAVSLSIRLVTWKQKKCITKTRIAVNVPQERNNWCGVRLFSAQMIKISRGEKFFKNDKKSHVSMS